MTGISYEACDQLYKHRVLVIDKSEDAYKLRCAICQAMFEPGADIAGAEAPSEGLIVGHIFNRFKTNGKPEYRFLKGDE
jgi:hypothetical protein